jgi:polar amino acid transport system substrate-binding protein
MKWLKTISILFLISLLVPRYALSEEITIAVGDWPPYLSNKLKHNGVIGHLLTDVFSEVGYDVKFTFFPWSRAYSVTKVGKQDMTGVWMHKPEREKDFYYSDPVLNEQFVFFHLKTTPFDWNTLEDLQGVMIGGGSEYSYGVAFDEALESGKIVIERVPTQYQNWRKLLLGRIQVFPEEMNVGYSSLKQHYPEDKVSLVTHHPKPLLNNLSYLLFPKSANNSPMLMKKFNAALKSFRESGRYNLYFKSFHNGYYDEK